MTNEITELGNYEVTAWLKETGWPTRESDLDEMIRIYHEWQQTIYMCKQSGAYKEEILVQMLSTRIKHIHPNPRDANVITAMLILNAAFLAKNEGIYSPGLTNRLH